jgi:hypothetical protein
MREKIQMKPLRSLGLNLQLLGSRQKMRSLIWLNFKKLSNKKKKKPRKKQRRRKKPK